MLNYGKWTIPITYKTNENNKSGTLWFDKDMDTLEIHAPNVKWFMLNGHGLEMYKTKLSPALWERIIKNFQNMDKATVEQIVSDAHYLFQFNMANCDTLIKLMEVVNRKENWYAFSQFYISLKHNFQCNNYNEELSIFVKFLQKRFDETKHSKKLIFNTDCTDSDNLAEKINKNILDKCAKWIKDYLEGTEDKTVKQI